MKKTVFVRRLLSLCLVLVLLVPHIPARALGGGVQVITTPVQQFCGADINLGGTNYLCAVDLGAPVIDSASDAELTAGSTVRFDLFFCINDSWYACRKQEMQGDPNSLFTVRVNKNQGGDRISNPVWKTYPDDGYGERYYLEFTVTGGETAAPVDVSVALTQPDAGNVGADYQIKGTSAAYGVCTANFNLPGYSGPCDVYFGDPVTSTGDAAAMIPGSTVCFPLMFMGGDGVLYAAYSTELQGTPDSLFELEQSGSSLLTNTGWKTWENGHWYLEYTVGQGDSGDLLEQQVRLRQSSAYKVSPAKNFSGTMGQKGQCVAPISIGGTVYDCTVDLQGYLTSTGDAQNMTADSTICFPLMFMGGDGQWYPVLQSELRGDPATLFAVEETITSGNTLLRKTGWKTWDSGHYFLEYTVADSEHETELDMSVLLKHADGSRKGVAVSFAGKAPASDNPFWKSCRVPINIGGTVYECVVDLQGYITSSGNNTLPAGGTVAFPLMFMGGDDQWYPVLKNELQGKPEDLLKVKCAATSGKDQLLFTGWGSWDNGHYYAEFKVTAAKEKTELKFTATLYTDEDHSGTPVAFDGVIAALPQEVAGPCTVPIKIDGTVYDCIVDLQGYITSSGNNTLPAGGTVAFPLMFMGGDGQWYPVLKGELQGNPAKLFSVAESITAGSALLKQSRWGNWDNGHYYLEYKVSEAKKDTTISFAVQLRQESNKVGNWTSFTGKVSGKTESNEAGQCIVPIKIDGTVYDCIVDLQGSLTSSGSTTLEGGGTVAFPLMFLGGDGVWYPVLKDELQGDPAELFTHTMKAASGGNLLTCNGWAYWEGGHYYLEYKVASPEKTTQLTFGVTLKTEDGEGKEDEFSGFVHHGKSISSQQIPLKPSASLVVERIEECQDFNTMSFTINGIRYNDGWPIDFESPNTTSAVITDGTIIRADLCFQVNGQWYPVRQQECNESVEDLFTYDFQVLSGDEFLGTPRFTTRYDAYGDIWQFEVAVNSEEEGEFCFTLQLVAKDGSKTGSKYKVTGRVQNGEMISTVEEIQEESVNNWLWIGFGGFVVVAIVAATLIVIATKKKKKQ